MMQYPFHRDFYNLVKDSINQDSVAFLLGPRKCGKTVCLKQLNEELLHSKYIDFKTLTSDEEKYQVFDNIFTSIKNNEDIVYLLDEVTYVHNIEIFINRLAMELADLEHPQTKTVFAGSQSVALEAWSNRAFAGNVGKIYANFLTYSEYLRFKGIEEISAKSYLDFLYNSSDFYNFNSLSEYLKGCIEETIISNTNTSEYIFDNDCYLIKDNIDFLINVCYQTLFTLHNHVTTKTFFQDDKLKRDIPSIFRETCKKMGDSILSDKIEKSFIGAYSSIRSQDIQTLKQAFIFLLKCDLITITPFTRDLENVPNIFRDLYSDDSKINYKDELFRSFNISFKYPMFYIHILKDILREYMPPKLPSTILGSIVECHARGLLPQGFEYHTSANNEIPEQEIDYINLHEGLAAEFTISAKHSSAFSILPDYINRILLTKNESSYKNGIYRIPYYEFLYELSFGDYTNNLHLYDFPFDKFKKKEYNNIKKKEEWYN